MGRRLGVCIIGFDGAVATTITAGIALMKKGIVPRAGMITEGEGQNAFNLASLDLAPLDEMVFGGWGLREDSIYEAALHHKVVQRDLLCQVKNELSSLYTWPAIVSSRFLKNMLGGNRFLSKSTREELLQIEKDILKFKAAHRVEDVVMVNLASTEKFSQMQDVHKSIEAFEAGLDHNDEQISPAMKYFYVACKMKVPHVNFTPSLTKVPALETLAEKCGVPIAGEDGKTGQTLLKTVLAPAFKLRNLQIEGWFSTNILGNNDGLVLNDPESNKTKILSKQKVLDSIVGYPVENHQVHIHYYKPRGDAKEAWDNIDITGFLGEPMQIKVDFLCKDSILAAPLILDLVRLVDCAKRAGERGIQRQLSMFFKSPYQSGDEQPMHDFFKQSEMLHHWVEKVSSKLGKPTKFVSEDGPT